LLDGMKFNGIPMVSYTDTLENIQKDFETRGIPTDLPGFYDHPVFMEIDAKHPEYLNNYARFVLSKSYSKEYLQSAEFKIRTVADAFHQELVRDGRLGACMDMCMVLSKILDQVGVWNFVVNGALTTTYPEESGIPNGYYWPIDIGPARAGHAWIFAPPFTVIDITIGHQNEDPLYAPFTPDFVYSQESADTVVGIEDICSSVIQAEMHLQGIPMLPEGLFMRRPELMPFFKIFNQTIFTHNKTEFKYIPVAISISDTPLEHITDLQLNGKYGHEIFEEKIKPVITPD